MPIKIRPTKKDRQRHSRQASQLRKQAQKATRRCDKRLQRTHLRLNPPSVYSVGENVFVRLRGRAWNKRHVTEARIEEKNIKLHIYKVAYTSPLTGKKERKWVPVDDITSLTLQPPGDGNCQFAALSHQVRKLGILRSPETMRKEIVAYLESNPYDSTGFPLLGHLADNEFASWNDYINHNL